MALKAEKVLKKNQIKTKNQSILGYVSLETGDRVLTIFLKKE